MSGNWFYDNRFGLKTFIRVAFGIVWLIDGIFKFIFLNPDVFSQMVQAGASGIYSQLDWRVKLF